MSDLLATCWTSAGNVRPGRTPEESPIPFPDRAEAISQAGFTGIGLELADLEVIRRTVGFGAARALLAEYGLEHVEVEFLNDWWLEGPRRAESDRRRHLLFDAAAELRAHHVKLGSGQPGDDRTPQRIVDELGLLGTEATRAGTRVAVETGAGSGLDLVTDVLPAVRALEETAVGILLDPWHFIRSGTPFDVIAEIPAADIFAVELSDGAAVAVGSLFDDTFDRRLFPGKGDFDVPAFTAAVRQTGWSGVWGVEVMSDSLRETPVLTVLTRAFEAARSVLG